MPRLLFLLIICSLTYVSQAQYSERRLSKNQQDYVDSLKKIDYPYKLPILGKKAYKLGIDIPYAGGMMVNYFGVTSSLIIENLQLGLSSNNVDIPLTPIDFVEFGSNKVSGNTINVRPDVWILPFLDVYGVFAYGGSRTEVNLVAPIKLQSIVEQSVKTAGFGLTAAFVVGPVLVIIDNNWTWTKPEKLDDPVSGKTFSFRLGHNFQFHRRPHQSLAAWVGGMRLKIGSGTVGQISLSEALPSDFWSKKDQVVNEYYDWYNGLDPSKPADLIKKDVADRVLTPIIERIDAADGSAVIRYGIDKRPKEEWNMIVGAQYQLSKRWSFRSEAGIVGDRKSLLVSASYRFNFF